MPKQITDIDINKIEKWVPPEEMKDTYKWLNKRIEQLKKSRDNVVGKNINKIWDLADAEYQPHRLNKKGKKILQQNEEDGWRSRYVQLQDEEWQSDNSSADVFTKIQIALSVLVDQNPSGTFTSHSSKYESNNLIVKEMYKHSWRVSKGKRVALKPFVFDLAKYGFAIMRTYPKVVKRTVTKNGVKEEITEYNDAFRERLNPRKTWIDDMANADDISTCRDWCWEVDYGYDAFMEAFPVEEYPFAKNVVPRSFSSETDGQKSDDDQKNKSIEKQYTDDMIVRVTFYENKLKDTWAVKANDVWICNEELPAEHKRLSCSYTYFNLRDPQTPYGIGVFEAMREDKILLDKITNMTIDQLVASIYKSFFHSGTDQMDGNGIIKNTPGLGKQLSDPKNITWNNVPGPGAEAWKGLDYFGNRVDVSSGISPSLQGEVMGKTLGETFQAKEAALKRLKTPLENITDALENEGYLTVKINAQIYSIPEIIKVVDPKLIDAYLKEINADPELWFRGDPNEQETEVEGAEEVEGEEVEEKNSAKDFYIKQFREVNIGLDTDDQGKLTETEDSRFFRVKPSGLEWEGTVTIHGESIIAHTKEYEKQLKLEFANLLIPMLAGDPGLNKKPAEQLCKIYEEDPLDWLPDAWMQPPADPNALIQPSEEKAPDPVADIASEPGQVTSPESNKMTAETLIPPSQISPGNPATATANAGNTPGAPIA